MTKAPPYDHLAEVKALAADCIEKAIELLPEYDEARTDEARTELTVHLLIHLRAIQKEADFLEQGRGIP